MSYAAKGEKVFAYQNPTFPDCTPQEYKRSDHRLKRFVSTFDRRAWDFCEEIRYRHLYDLMSGSRTCLGIDQCHKYVPLEDLLRILMAEKDQLIKNLQDQWTQGDGDKRMLLNQIAGLTEEVNKSRDMLRQAMHKLENIDEIVNENKKLQCRLRCSEERVKYLEEKKKKLESELADLRSRSQIQMDLERAKMMLSQVIQRREESTEVDEIVLQSLSLERNDLQDKIKQLEKELKEARQKEAEIEILKKQSQSDSLDREEICRENECYKRKLASMKCLEKQIQELKKQGRALADKYRKESQKAAEQLSKMSQAAKELQCIREERDSLRKRVNELSSYECQYNKLQRKLQRVDAVIAENECLNSKLVALQKLEKENEYLKCRLEAIQEVEVSAVEDKEKIMQLQCAVADQEEEMKDLLCQIERLTSGRHEEELERLRCELYEKNCKLKLCEEQLAEVPMLEAEIDELRMKLQCCCRDFPDTKKGASSYQKVEVRFPSTSTGIRANYKTPGRCASLSRHALQDEGKVHKTTSECKDKKEMMICEEVQCLLQSSKGIISCVLEDMVEHQKEMEELEVCNRAMKEEIETLKAEVGKSDNDCLLQEINNLRRALEQKNAEICRLRQQAGRSENREDVETLRELNKQMKAELEPQTSSGLKQVAELETQTSSGLKQVAELETQTSSGLKQVAELEPQTSSSLKQVAELEKMLEAEKNARNAVEKKLQGEEPETAGKVLPEDPDFDCCGSLQKEIQDLKNQIVALNSLTDELKKENQLLRELQQPCPDFSKELDEKCALENLLSLLQAELDAFKGQKLSDECEALRCELKRVMEQNCQLKTLVDCYRQRLNLEKQSNQLIQGVMQSDMGLRSATPGGQVVSSPSEQKRSEEGKMKEAEKIAGPKFPIVTPSGQVISSPSEMKRHEEKKQKEDEEKRLKEAEEKRLKEAEEKRQREAEEKRLKDADEKGQKEAEEKRLKEAEEKRLKEAEEKRLKEAEEQRQKEAEEKRQREAEEKRLKEAGEKGQKEAEEKRLKEAEEKRLKEAEEKRLKEAEEKRLKEGEEKRLKEAEEKRLKEAEEKRLKEAEEKRLKEAEEKRLKEAEEKRLKETEEKRQREAEEKRLKEAEEKAKEEARKVIPSAGAMKSPSEEVRAKADKQAEAALKSKLDSCDQELKALNDKLAKVQQENENLKNSLKETEKKLAAAEKAAAEPKVAEPKPAEPKPAEPKPAAPSKQPTDLEDKLKQMEAENAEKIKKLMEQHEKELANREKKYNETLNAMKAGYETDIRKLTERHKQSVMRLQGLHEDEVQDLNTAYETQLETMQTQSEEAMSDVARGSAAKLRKLAEKHAKEMKDMEAKVTDLKGDLTRSRVDLIKAREDAETIAAQLKARYSREMNKLKRTNTSKLNTLKEAFDEDRKKLQAEAEDLRKKLKEMEASGGTCDCKTKKPKTDRMRDPTCPLDFNEVIEKILEQGLDALTFNEIAFVHRKTCCALEGIMMNSKVCPTLEPPVGDGCPHTPLLEADKQQLLSRIFALEKDILQKQRQTQEAIISMELAIKKERCRLQEVKNSLQNEQQKNSELRLLLSSQTKIESDLKKERDKLGNQASLHQSLCEEKSRQLDEEIKNKQCLEMEVEKLKSKLKQISNYMAMNNEKGGSDCKQANQMEMMRVKLEQSMNQERRLVLQLENEAKYRIQLQCQLQALRQSFRQMVNLPEVEHGAMVSQNPLEAKSAKERQNLDQIKEKKNKIKTKTVKKYKK